MAKELHIWMDDDYPPYITLTTYRQTDTAIKDGFILITHTTITDFCNTKYLSMGYRIFVHMIDEEIVEIKLGNKNKHTDREIRMETNIHNLLLANEFGKAVE